MYRELWYTSSVRLNDIPFKLLWINTLCLGLVCILWPSDPAVLCGIMLLHYTPQYYMYHSPLVFGIWEYYIRPLDVLLSVIIGCNYYHYMQLLLLYEIGIIWWNYYHWMQLVLFGEIIIINVIYNIYYWNQAKIVFVSW